MTEIRKQDFPAGNRAITPDTVASVQKSTKSPADFARALRGKSGTLLLDFRWKHKEISPVSVLRGRGKTVSVLP
jgi:hypothetical protein